MTEVTSLRRLIRQSYNTFLSFDIPPTVFASYDAKQSKCKATIWHRIHNYGAGHPIYSRKA